jgi:hypothetical protein
MNVTAIPAEGWMASLVALRGEPRVTVARYDALQAARRAPATAAIPPLQIVAPLSIEPIYFVARASSPLEYIHDIQGRSINAGPPDSSRALTAHTVYRQMFDSDLPDLGHVALNEAAALQQLREDKTLDVVVLVGPDASALIEGLRAQAASDFKLLKLDSGNPQSRKLVHTFLQTTVPASSLGMPEGEVATPAVMSFLVTASSAPSDQAAHDSAIAALADAVCRELPGLQRDMPRWWAGVQPSLQLDVGWPYSRAAQAEFADCSQPR